MMCLQIVNYFAENASLFSEVNDIELGTATLRNDLTVINNQVFQWKIAFNPDLTNKSQDVVFSKNAKKLIHTSLPFNKILLKNICFKNILG